MKVAILGGGFTGLTAAYYLAKKGHKVTIFEKEKILGGMASGFKASNWDWYLEKTYHHLFSNDSEILNFAKEIGFSKIFFRLPETASLYKNSKLKAQNSNPNLKSKNYSIYPLDTVQDFLKFPPLSLAEKIRAGMVLAFLKFSPFFSFYERQTAKEFLQKTMGERGWNILWQPLFRKKFGKYAENILSSFIWARIKKRTKKLGYVEGGFQTFINYLEKKLKGLKVRIFKGSEVREIKKEKDKFILTYTKHLLSIGEETYEIVISTLPTPVLTTIGKKLFPADYLSQLKKINYLHALTLIIESPEKLLEKTYWLNVATEEIPIMGVVQQTNFIDKKYYGGKHILYLGWYLKLEDRKWKMEDRELLDFIIPYLKQINPNYQLPITNYFVFRSLFAQPIFDKDFLKNKSELQTPVKNFYIANLDMTYPYDRGTNYAVDLGKKIVYII